MNNEATESKPIILPKLREGITLKFNGYDYDGIPHWILYDAGRNNFFVIGWPEFEMLNRWHLGNPHLIVEAVNKETTIRVDTKDFDNLVNFLDTNYLIHQKWYNIYNSAKKQKVFKNEHVLYWLIRYYLFFRIPLLHPDKFLDKTRKLGEILFHRYTGYFMTILGLIAIYQIGTRWEEFSHTFSSIFSWQGLVFYMIAFSIAKFFHELGHAYMCKKYGVNVPTMGVALLVFWPVLYTDTTLSWSLPSHQRMRIALAGMWLETYITIFAALIWCNTSNLTIQMICYVTVAVNWVGTLLINVSPFMRFDGYYVFSDFLKVPNLQNRAFALTRWQIRYWLFGWEEPAGEQFSKRMHYIMVTYAFVTWIYRLSIYFGIALLVYHYFFKIIGIFLFAIEMYAFILRPFVHEVMTWFELRKQFSWNNKTKITFFTILIAITLFFIPINQKIRFSGTISYAHEFLFAPYDGIVENEPPSIGAIVASEQPIIKIQSPELDFNLEKAKHEYDKTLAELRRASISNQYMEQKNILMAQLSEKEEELKRLNQLKSKMELKAPFRGKIADIASNVYSGVVVMKDQWIADIIDPSTQIIEGFVDDFDYNDLTEGATGYFYPNNIEEPVIPVTILIIEPSNTPSLLIHYSKQLKQDSNKEMIANTSSYNSTELGGKIPTNISENGEYVPVNSIYRILLIPSEPYYLKHVEVGTVVLTIKSKSYASRVFYKIKRILVQESGF